MTEPPPAAAPYDPAFFERKAEVGADAFFALDLRVGRVVEVEPFPEARKPAWRLRVDFGPHVGVLATSAQVTNDTRDELRGRLVVEALNLGTKRIAGFASEFLVLGALEADGTVLLLGVPDGGPWGADRVSPHGAGCAGGAQTMPGELGGRPSKMSRPRSAMASFSSGWVRM